MPSRLTLIKWGAIALGILVLFIYIQTLRLEIQELSGFKSLYQTSQQEAKIWQDKDNAWRIRVQAAEITKENLKDLAEVKTLIKQFNLKKSGNNLESYIQTNTETTIHKQVRLKDTTIYFGDTVTVPAFNYHDQWMDIRGVVQDGKVDLKIQNQDSLQVVTYWKRSWFLGKKKYFTEIKSSNPSTKLTYEKSIKVKKRRGLF